MVINFNPGHSSLSVRETEVLIRGFEGTTVFSYLVVDGMGGATVWDNSLGYLLLLNLKGIKT